jgi:hypothetical protein
MGGTLQFTSTVTDDVAPLHHQAIATGLTSGTAYWFDLALASAGINPVEVTGVNCNAHEF